MRFSSIIFMATIAFLSSQCGQEFEVKHEDLRDNLAPDEKTFIYGSNESFSLSDYSSDLRDVNRYLCPKNQSCSFDSRTVFTDTVGNRSIKFEIIIARHSGGIYYWEFQDKQLIRNDLLKLTQNSVPR